MKTRLSIGSTVVSPQPSPPGSAGRRRRPRDLWLIIALAATTGAAFLFTGPAALMLCALAVPAVIARRRGRSPGASVVTGLAALAVCVFALTLAMPVLSRLPAERRFQQCMEQPDVSQCHDPLTSWLH